MRHHGCRACGTHPWCRMLHAVRICALDSRHPDLLHIDLPRSCQQDPSDRASMQLGSPRSHTTRCIWHKTRLCTGVHCASELHNSPQVAKPCPCTALAGRVVQGTAVAGMVPCTLAGMVPCTTMPASAAESGRQTNGRGRGRTLPPLPRPVWAPLRPMQMVVAPVTGPLSLGVAARGAVEVSRAGTIVQGRAGEAGKGGRKVSWSNAGRLTLALSLPEIKPAERDPPGMASTRPQPAPPGPWPQHVPASSARECGRAAGQHAHWGNTQSTPRSHRHP